MTTRGRVPVAVLSPVVQAAIANLHAALRQDPTLHHVQVTFSHLPQPERVPTVDVVRESSASPASPASPASSASPNQEPT